ncbi:response regulator transcription factor [Halosimplex litoreum]|uniref:Response regulator transcription factor n=1 Tax=Halosimplex litoreum TaxID=1198301 RepID=A0A7U3WTA9_9EURY|nr:response regulator transcription factor [Halosimplex litoreum]
MLVVDDDEAVADVYASQLSESYDVSTAYDGESALEQVTEDVDVVLLDRRMHGLSGREVLERIRGRDIDCGVVMVTAVDPGFDIVDMGFDDYLLKPVEGAQLQSVVAEAVNRLDKRAVVREYHALSAKVATLRVEKNPAELESSEEYQRLRARLDDLETRIEDAGDTGSSG